MPRKFSKDLIQLSLRTLGVAKVSAWSPSSMVSKYCVSTSDCNSGTTGASFCLMVSHVHVLVLKNRCFFTSSAPPVPSLEELRGETERVITGREAIWKVSLPFSQELGDEIFGLQTNMAVTVVRLSAMSHDLGVGSHDTLRIERSVSHQHLVQDHTHWPPVTLAAIVTIATLWSQHLGRDVIRCSYRCVRSHFPVLRERGQCDDIPKMTTSSLPHQSSYRCQSQLVWGDLFHPVTCCLVWYPWGERDSLIPIPETDPIPHISLITYECIPCHEWSLEPEPVPQYRTGPNPQECHNEPSDLPCHLLWTLHHQIQLWLYDIIN